jgi:hypothetical protein
MKLEGTHVLESLFAVGDQRCTPSCAVTPPSIGSTVPVM